MTEPRIWDRTVSQGEIARLLGCSGAWVGKLRGEGVLPVPSAPLSAVIQAWVAYQTGQREGETEKDRLTREQADAQAMKNARMRGELLPRAEVDAAMVSVCSRIRTRVRRVADAVAPRVAIEARPTAVRDTIAAELDNALSELAETRVIVAESGPDDSGSGDR